MADVSIICDASFDERLKIAGFSGNLQITLEDGQQITQMYDSAKAECGNVQDSEIFAMHLGLMVLKRYVSANDLRVDSITIHTDSLSSIKAMQKVLRDPNSRNPSRDALLNMDYVLQKNGWHYRLAKVNAHVPMHLANPTEKIHNMVDARSVSARLALTDHLFRPKLNSQWYSVVLPALPAADLHQSYHDLGYQLAKEGRRARVYIHDDHGNTADIHPFVNGILSWADENNLSADALMTQMFYMPNNPKESLDLTLYRHHCVLQGAQPLPLGGSKTSIEHRAQFASSFLYGPAFRGLEIQNLTGRHQPASAFVLDLTNGPHDTNAIPAWIERLLCYTHIPLKRGLSMDTVELDRVPPPGVQMHIGGKIKSSINPLPTPPKQTNPLGSKEVSEAITSLYANALLSSERTAITPEVMTRLIVGKLASFGLHITLPAALKSLQLNVYCAMTAKRPDPVADAQFILKHITKMRLVDPPQKQAAPPAPSEPAPAVTPALSPEKAPSFSVRN